MIRYLGQGAALACPSNTFWCRELLVELLQRYSEVGTIAVNDFRGYMLRCNAASCGSIGESALVADETNEVLLRDCWVKREPQVETAVLAVVVEGRVVIKWALRDSSLPASTPISPWFGVSCCTKDSMVLEHTKELTQQLQSHMKPLQAH